jgi:hypothetical protein
MALAEGVLDQDRGARLEAAYLAVAAVTSSVPAMDVTVAELKLEAFLPTDDATKVRASRDV